MSGYGGQVPGWNDPYGYGPPPGSGGSQTPGSTIAAIICSCLALGFCCNILAIPAIVTSVMAASRAGRDLESANRLTQWSWVILTLAFVLPILAGVTLFAVDALHGGLDDEGL